MAEAKAWYTKMFDGVPGKRSNYDAVDLPGINLNFSEGPRPTVPTKGRMLITSGSRVQDFRPSAGGSKHSVYILMCPTAKDGRRPASARLTDPWGTSIELTEGLRAVSPASTRR